MKAINILITFLFLNIFSMAQQSNDHSLKCNIETIKELRENKESITDKLLLNFLLSLDKSCNNNVEFSEASNGTLFWLADNETERFVRILKNDNIDRELIIEMFKQPIHDLIDLEGIYKKIKYLNDNHECVLKILESIKFAAKGLGEDIK